MTGPLRKLGKISHRKKALEVLRTSATWNTPEFNKAAQRIKRFSTHDILNQIEGTCLEMDKALFQYRKNGDYAALKELHRNVSILQAAVEGLYDRDFEF